MIAQELTLKLIEKNRIPKSLTLSCTTTQYSSTPLRGTMAIMKSAACSDPRRRCEYFLNGLFSKKFIETQQGPKSIKEQMIQAYLKRDQEEPLSVLGSVSQLSACLTHRVTRERLLKIKNSGIPTLIITGDEDYMVNHANSIYLNEILEPDEFIILEGCGHAVHIERYKEFNEAVLKILNKGSQAATAEEATKEGEHSSLDSSSSLTKQPVEQATN
jgi:esterase/lipase